MTSKFTAVVPQLCQFFKRPSSAVVLWSVDKHLFIFRELSPQSEIHETNENQQLYASAGLFESSNKKVESKTVQIFLSTFQQCGDTV